MFFSKLTINFKELDFKLKEDFLYQDKDYTLHQIVWKFFTHESSRNFLYHVRRNNQFHLNDYEIFVLSENKPLILNISGIKLETKVFNPQFFKNQMLGFDLRVAPRVKDQNHKQYGLILKFKKENPHLQGFQLQISILQEIKSWLQRKCLQGGFELLDLTLIEQHIKTIHKPKALNEPLSVKFDSFDVSGIIKIDDPLKFKDLLLFGIGSQKSFGCGLMLLRMI